MLGLTAGELFVVLFILFVVVSAPWWPRAGEAIATALTGGGAEDDSPRKTENGAER